MKERLKTNAFGAASALVLTLLVFGWAAPTIVAAAHFLAGENLIEGGAVALNFSDENGQRATSRQGAALPRQGTALPSPVRLSESGGRGLLVKTWINGVGPFSFAVDTGAGAIILSPRVAGAARVEVEVGGRGIEVGGLSGASARGGQKAFVRGLAVGSRENSLPAHGLTIVASGLPSDVDGVLDPTEAFSPYGYVIDIPRGELRAFDPRVQPLHKGDAPPDGAVVPWLTEGGSRRPFVMLAEGRRALIDTGSGFGLAVDEAAARTLGLLIDEGRRRGTTRDIAGGEVHARRVRAATVTVGALVLRGVPTDFLLHAEKGAPVILGRDALRPFRLTFDPASRLVMFEPVEN